MTVTQEAAERAAQEAAIGTGKRQYLVTRGGPGQFRLLEARELQLPDNVVQVFYPSA